MHKRKIYLFIRIHDHPLSKLSVCYPFRCGQFYLLLFLFQGNKTKKELHKCVFFLFFTPGKIQTTERKRRYSKSFCCCLAFCKGQSMFIHFIQCYFRYTNRYFIFCAFSTIYSLRLPITVQKYWMESRWYH